MTGINAEEILSDDEKKALKEVGMTGDELVMFICHYPLSQYIDLALPIRDVEIQIEAFGNELCDAVYEFMSEAIDIDSLQTDVAIMRADAVLDENFSDIWNGAMKILREICYLARGTRFPDRYPIRYFTDVTCEYRSVGRNAGIISYDLEDAL